MRRHVFGLVTIIGGAFALSACAPEVKVFVKGGVGNYTAAAAQTAAGPSWGAALDVDPLPLLGIEVGYDGSSNNLNNFPSASLLRNGATGLVKLSPIPLPIIKPFIGAGLGGSYVSVRSGTPGFQSAFIQEIPVAIGIELSVSVLTAGVRATYRFLSAPGFASNSSLGIVPGGFFDTQLTLGLRI